MREPEIGRSHTLTFLQFYYSLLWQALHIRRSACNSSILIIAWSSFLNTKLN